MSILLFLRCEEFHLLISCLISLSFLLYWSFCHPFLEASLNSLFNSLWVIELCWGSTCFHLLQPPLQQDLPFCSPKYQHVRTLMKSVFLGSLSRHNGWKVYFPQLLRKPLYLISGPVEWSECLKTWYSFYFFHWSLKFWSRQSLLHTFQLSRWILCLGIIHCMYSFRTFAKPMYLFVFDPSVWMFIQWAKNSEPISCQSGYISLLT